METETKRGRSKFQDSVLLLLAGILIVSLIGMFFLIVLPKFLGHRHSANEPSAAASIRQIGSCAEIYEINHPDIGFPNDVVDMGPGTGNDGCLDMVLTAATGAAQTPKSGYVFTYKLTTTVDGVNTGYVITGAPVVCGRTGVKTFWSDETGRIRFENDPDRCKQAGPTSPVMG